MSRPSLLRLLLMLLTVAPATAMPRASSPDHEYQAYAKILHDYVHNARVDYSALKRSRTALDAVVAAFAEPTDRFVVRLIGDGPPLVLDPKEVESARERIKTRYNVLKEQNLEEQPASKGTEQANKT
jgi:hypothetical protein